MIITFSRGIEALLIAAFKCPKIHEKVGISSFAARANAALNVMCKDVTPVTCNSGRLKRLTLYVLSICSNS